VAEDISLSKLHDGSVKKMQIAATDCAAGNFENDILRFDNTWFGDLLCIGVSS
jgi:hypothetical protein